ncbi:MAG: hypothetical protein WAM98_12875, partial [Terriglobales bacterium]
MKKRFSNDSSATLSPSILPQPRGVTSLIKLSRRQSHDSSGGIHLAGLELEAMKLKKENANHKPRALIPIHKRMVADDARRVQGRHFDNVRRFGIGIVLSGTRKRGLQKAAVTQPRGAAVERQESVVDREHVALFDPEWFFLFHLVSLLGKSVQRVAI